jgi:hypothetical protein
MIVKQKNKKIQYYVNVDKNNIKTLIYVKMIVMKMMEILKEKMEKFIVIVKTRNIMIVENVFVIEIKMKIF